MRIRLLVSLACSVAAIPAFSVGPAMAQPPSSTTEAPPASARPSLYEPSLSPDGATIAFVSGGDIWEASASGGVAHLLVTGAATEGRPLYSPDGRKLAFTSTRGGSANIFVLDLASGSISRITFAEANEELDSWSADGRYLYFASGANDVGRVPDIFRVAADGGTPIEVSRERYLAEFQAAPAPDGSAIVLAARGISNGQWWRNGHSHIDETEIWLKPLAENAGYRKLIADGAKHAWPMWSPDGAAILYMSDLSGTENLWRLPLSGGGKPEQLTRFTSGRLLYPAIAANGSAIVFERDFGIWRYDMRSGQAEPVAITLRGSPAREERRHVTLSSFARMGASPDGQKVAVIAHGELFAVPAKEGGQAQRLTTSVGAERELVWSPDSRKIAYVTERGLDRLLAEIDVASGKEVLLTRRGVASVPAYAPDGRSIAYVLDDKSLRVIDLPRDGRPGADRLLFTGALATDERGGPGLAWSPDGAWIAFPLTDRRSFTNVSVIPAAGGDARPVSFLANGQMNGIVWSPDGKYILFDTAQRSESSDIVRIDLLPHVPKYREDAFKDLFKTDKSPGTPAAPAEAPPKSEAPAPLPAARRRGKPAVPVAAAGSKVPPVTIVWAGLRARATILPLGLNADTPVISADGKTLVFRASERGQTNLYSYNLDELATEPAVPQQISQTARPKGDFGVTADGKTLFFLDGGTVVSTPLETPKPKAIAIAAAMDVDFATEKQVVFDEAWGTLDRRFFDPAFNGKDWKALRARVQPYVEGAKTSDELRRIINLMIGELNASHSGINRPARGEGALPSDRVGRIGLQFDREAYEQGRGLVVRQVIDLGPASIAKVGVGDRLASIDGQVIGPKDNIDALLENKVGARVTLGIESAAGRREVVVQPVSASVESGLHYRQWVAGRRAMVERMSNGQLGYVHIPDMSSESLNQLYLDLDSENQGRRGVVIDIRNNNGGFINGYALDVFSRRNFLTMTPRDLFALPSRQALGQRALGLPTILLTNESSLSDAEDFTEGYRALGLGKVVGQPTSGWIIYTSGEPLIDGSTVRVPSTRIQDAEGRDLEMHPRPVDLAVERPLGETLSGDDAQLSAAVQMLLGQLGASR